jgi:biopolymer transport protein ExbD
MAISSRNKRSISFSMSGMTDIVFLLLIFFMLTSTLIVPAAMNVLLPQSNNQTAASPVVSVSITRNLEYFVNDEQCNLADLELKLKALVNNTEDSPTIRLNADENLNMNEIYDFLEIAKRNRFRVILGTRPL